MLCVAGLWGVVVVAVFVAHAHASDFMDTPDEDALALPQPDEHSFQVAASQGFPNPFLRQNLLPQLGGRVTESIPDITDDVGFKKAVHSTVMFGDDRQSWENFAADLHHRSSSNAEDQIRDSMTPQTANMEPTPQNRAPVPQLDMRGGTRPMEPGKKSPPTPTAIDKTDPDNFFPVPEPPAYRIKQFWHILRPIYPVIIAGITHPNEVKPDWWFPLVLHHLIPIAIKFLGSDMDVGSLPVPPGYVPTLKAVGEDAPKPLPTNEHRPGMPSEDKFPPAPPPPPIPPPLPKGYDSKDAQWRGHIIMPPGFENKYLGNAA